MRPWRKQFVCSNANDNVCSSVSCSSCILKNPVVFCYKKMYFLQRICFYWRKIELWLQFWPKWLLLLHLPEKSKQESVVLCLIYINTALSQTPTLCSVVRVCIFSSCSLLFFQLGVITLVWGDIRGLRLRLILGWWISGCWLGSRRLISCSLTCSLCLRVREESACLNKGSRVEFCVHVCD